MEEREIIHLFQIRDEQAIAAVDEKYGGLCRRLAENILGDRRDAEECVNEAYLGLWQAIPPAEPERLSAYLIRIVRNRAIARYHANTARKRNGRFDAALEELEGVLAASYSAEERLAERDLKEAINDFLAGLPMKDRILFLRRYWFGESLQEAAKAAGMASGTAAVRLFRLRNKLKTYLEQEGYDGP